MYCVIETLLVHEFDFHFLTTIYFKTNTVRGKYLNYLPIPLFLLFFYVKNALTHTTCINTGVKPVLSTKTKQNLSRSNGASKF